MDPQLVIFAIQSAVKLGRKIYDVLVDGTVETPLVLPVGELRANVEENKALVYFTRPENAHLISPGGPYAGLNKEKRLQAYRTLLAINERLDVRQDNLAAAAAIVRDLHGFLQFRAGQGAKSPLQRILGTVFEIGVDYFTAHPESLSRNSNAQRVIASFLQGIETTDFAEGSPTEIVGAVLGSALETLGANPGLMGDDRRLQVLLGGITAAAVNELKNNPQPDGKESLTGFVHRIAGSLVRGGLGAFDENLELFLPGDGTVKKLVHSTVSQFLTAIRDHEDLFTSDTLALVFKSALAAAGENADLFTKNAFLQQLLERTFDVLTETPTGKLFSEATFSSLIRETLDVVRENIETLVDPERPDEHLLAAALSAITQSLVTTLANGGAVKDLLSNRQLIELVRVVFQSVAQHPEQLLGENLSDPKRTALAQIISSVAAALGEDPKRLVNGTSFIELVRLTLPIAINNVDQLVDLEKGTPRTNVLFGALSQIAQTVLAQGDPRRIVTREVFVEIVRRVLPIVSANIDALADKPVSTTLATALTLASGTLQSRINGDNLPVLVEQLLRRVVAKQLNLEESTAVDLAARQILLAA